MMPSFSCSILVIVIVLCLQQFVTVAAGGSGTDDICSYDYEINCLGGSPYAAITSVTLASAVSSGGGEAYVTFHWGQAHADTNVGSILQSMNTPQTLKESHEYYQEGEYYAGVSIVFGAGSGCNGVRLQGYKLLTFVGLSCDVIDIEQEEAVDGSLAGTTSSTLAVVSRSSHFLSWFWLATWFAITYKYYVFTSHSLLIFIIDMINTHSPLQSVPRRCCYHFAAFIDFRSCRFCFNLLFPLRNRL